MKNIINSGWNLIIRIKNANLIYVQPLFIYSIDLQNSCMKGLQFAFLFLLKILTGVWKQFNKTESKHVVWRFSVNQMLLKMEVCKSVKKETSAQVFSCDLSKIFKNNLFTEHLQTTI